MTLSIPAARAAIDAYENRSGFGQPYSGDVAFAMSAVHMLPAALDEIERLRTALAVLSSATNGFVRCENSRCLARIDQCLINSSSWNVDARGRWLCPAHQEIK